jgi:hypothetical protein
MFPLVFTLNWGPTTVAARDSIRSNEEGNHVSKNYFASRLATRLFASLFFCDLFGGAQSKDRRL